jgi:hypothetical protein
MQKKYPKGFFCMCPRASKLLCSRVGSEKLFINSEKFILSYLKRYTVPVGKDHSIEGACAVSLTFYSYVLYYICRFFVA